MAYHIAISGANTDAASIRLEWEFYYEGVPDYTVYNQYHIQVIAGVVKIEYVGDLQDVSGRIEVGLAMHDETNMTNIVVVGQVDMKKTWMYRSYPVL